MQVQITVEQISDEVQTLSLEDLRKVRELADSLLENKEESKPVMTKTSLPNIFTRRALLVNRRHR